MRLGQVIGAGLFSLLGAVNAAKADVTYDYVGNPFTSADRPLWGTSLNVSVTFDSTVTSNFTGYIGPADIVSITPSFVNGDFPFVRIPSQYDITDFVFSKGTISDWDIELSDLGQVSYVVMTEHITGLGGVNALQDLIGGYTCCAGADNFNAGAAGVWTVASAPEPVTWVLMLVGLGGVGGALRGRSKLNVTARRRPESFKGLAEQPPAHTALTA